MNAINGFKEKFKGLSEKITSSPKRKLPVILIVPVIIGIISSFCLYSSELNEFDYYKKSYANHEHSWDCKELICLKNEHTHSSLCRDCGLSSWWHTHTDSCYCSKTEHTHELACYENDCDYSKWDSEFAYAEAKTRFVVPNLILLISLLLIVFNAWLTRSSSSIAEKIYSIVKNNEDNFFNEKSDLWLFKLKNWTIIIFVFEVFGFITFGIIDAIKRVTPLGTGLEHEAFWVWACAGTLFAFLTKNANMLILQFLNNINTIREKAEQGFTATETVENDKNEEETAGNDCEEKELEPETEEAETDEVESEEDEIVKRDEE